MDFIKTEPDLNAELYPASCSKIELVNVKQEAEPELISFPLVQNWSDVSVQPVFQWHAVVNTF